MAYLFLVATRMRRPTSTRSINFVCSRGHTTCGCRSSRLPCYFDQESQNFCDVDHENDQNIQKPHQNHIESIYQKTNVKTYFISPFLNISWLSLLSPWQGEALPHFPPLDSTSLPVRTTTFILVSISFYRSQYQLVGFMYLWPFKCVFFTHNVVINLSAESSIN